ncbi:hypothetical protein Nepgr_010270 [Nepenthes gracilis]|uniref:PHD-type domain-containing protein n=1 Tax=Nepenthes gracilis TaxID=150966 RepID=A0AAD3XL58_NEPGR|nr:hypothetical protein Nepgr_010270 [Nepenthes gracilis]
MEEGNRSGGHSCHLVKNKNSSGCLIIKKKPEGSGRVGSSGSQKVYVSKKEKKRPRLVVSDPSLSDDELLEFHRRRGVPGTNQISSGSVVYKKRIVKESELSNKSEYIKGFGKVDFGKNVVGDGERKRRKLDVHEFDEYDDLTDVEKTGKGYFDGREVEGSGRRFLGVKVVTKSGSGREFGSGSSMHDVIYRRKNSFLESTSNGKIRADFSLVKNNFETKGKVPNPMMNARFGSLDEAIRLQGKNGVLKLMVNKKEKVNGTLKTQSCIEVGKNRIVPGTREIIQKKITFRPSPYTEQQVQQERNTFDRIENDKPKSQKSLPPKSSETSYEASENSDPPPKLPLHNVETHKLKRGRSEVGGSPSSKRLQPTRLKEGKVKRGSGTEKQLLREQIRSMLVSAGWTIDYRPRRNRDYLDAVYINPTGTAYWSIIKAYDAFQKQLEDEGANAGEDCSPFMPISEEVLSKLTRQTRKKIEKELKKKKKDDVRIKRKKQASTMKYFSSEDDTDSSYTGKDEEKLSSFIKQKGKSLKDRLHEARNGVGSNSTIKRLEKCSSASNSVLIHARRSKKIGRCTLLVRNSEKGLNFESDGFVPYKGKRTLLSWLIDSGTVKLSEKVHYMNRRRSRIMLEGWITRDGIHCSCCSKILTVSKFEIHAASKLRQPFQNIYLSSGPSLSQCQLDAWNRQDESHRRGYHEVDVDGDDLNDDTCGICGDGGDLICCDGCPSTFHQSCLDIEMLPSGDWHCLHCSCKFCGLVEVSTTQRNATTLGTLLKCSLCETKYHSSCMQGMDAASVSSRNASTSFCGWECQELFEQLHKLLGVKHELEGGLSWSLIHRTDLESDISVPGISQRVEWNSKLAVALSVMDECFLPIIDRRSSINLIHNVIYNCGSNFNRLNYSGFYTAVLERGDEIISAASVRIHGTQLAEMPYIGTRHIYRRQGMFRRLLAAIESALHYLKVEKLIIPAISELMQTWTTVFGFSSLEESHKQEMKSFNMLVFPGTDMLQKKLVEQETPEHDVAVCTGMVSLKVGVVPESSNKSAAAIMLQNDEIDDSSSTDVTLHDQAASLNYPSVLSASLDVTHEPKPQVLNEGYPCTLSFVSETEDKLAESVLDAKVHYSLEASTRNPEEVKYLTDLPSKHNTQTSADCEKHAIELVPDANLGSQLLYVSIDDNSVGDSLLYASRAIKHCASSKEYICSASLSAVDIELSASDVKHLSLMPENVSLGDASNGNQLMGIQAADLKHVLEVEQSLLNSADADKDCAEEVDGAEVANLHLACDSFGEDSAQIVENMDESESKIWMKVIE